MEEWESQILELKQSQQNKDNTITRLRTVRITTLLLLISKFIDVMQKDFKRKEEMYINESKNDCTLM
jgi:hypothetical protein